MSNPDIPSDLRDMAEQIKETPGSVLFPDPCPLGHDKAPVHTAELYRIVEGGEVSNETLGTLLHYIADMMALPNQRS